MAARPRREKDFYVSLNNVSTVDFLPKIRKQRRMKGSGRLWEVERLIDKRINGMGATEYLVLWRGYSPFESTWEPEDNVSADCVRLFKNPSPDEVVIFNEVTTFRIAVERHLRSKCRLPVTIKFRRDVYRFLFKNKGHQQHGWQLLRKVSFPPRYFPEFWDHCPDSHGQGVKVLYPLKLRTSISWSPKKYSLGVGHNLCPRAFQEKLTFTFIRVALGDGS